MMRYRLNIPLWLSVARLDSNSMESAAPAASGWELYENQRSMALRLIRQAAEETIPGARVVTQPIRRVEMCGNAYEDATWINILAEGDAFAAKAAFEATARPRLEDFILPSGEGWHVHKCVMETVRIFDDRSDLNELTGNELIAALCSRFDTSFNEDEAEPDNPQSLLPLYLWFKLNRHEELAALIAGVICEGSTDPMNEIEELLARRKVA